MSKENSPKTVVGGVAKTSGFAKISSGSKRKRIIVFAIVIVVILAAGGYGAYRYYQSRQQPAQVEYDPYNDAIRALLEQPLPKEPMDQVAYYSSIGSNFEASARGQSAEKQEPKLEKAIEYYLKAQRVIDENKITDIAIYAAIAGDYQQLGREEKAKEYWQKQIDYLNAFKAAHPDDAAMVEEGIKAAQDKINQL